MDKGREIEVWFAVKVHFIVDELVCCGGFERVLGDPEFGDILCCAVAGGVRRAELAGKAMHDGRGGTLVALHAKEFIGVNVLRVSGGGAPTVSTLCKTIVADVVSSGLGNWVGDKLFW